MPATRGVNTGGLLDRSAFVYQPETDCLLCPEGKTLRRKQLSRKDCAIYYQAEASDCASCPRKAGCTTAPQRMVSRHLHDEALNRMHQRATPDKIRLRRCTVEHRFATLKYRIFGHPRWLLRGVRGAQTEISLAAMAYNLKRMVNTLGALVLTRQLASA